MSIEITIDYQVRATLFSMMRMYNLLAQTHNITQSVGYVLIVVPREGIPATKIAPALGMSSSSLGRLLKSMEENNLITKEINKKDKRITKIYLTPKAVILRNKIKKTVVNFNEKVVSQISANDMAIFNKVSEVIRLTSEEEIEVIKNNFNKIPI